MFIYPEANIGTRQFSLFVQQADIHRNSWIPRVVLGNLKTNMRVRNRVTYIHGTKYVVIQEF